MNPDTLSARILAVGDTHQVDLPLRWGDSDALNHLNNTLYFRLMEEARMRILYDAGFELPANDGAILAHASCDFAPADLSGHRASDPYRDPHRPFQRRIRTAAGKGRRRCRPLRARPQCAGLDGLRGQYVRPWPPEVLAKMATQFQPAA